MQDSKSNDPRDVINSCHSPLPATQPNRGAGAGWSQTVQIGQIYQTQQPLIAALFVLFAIYVIAEGCILGSSIDRGL